MKIRPKNWGDFQHYKDRSPDWIKLHRRLLDDFEFQTLPVESRALAPMLWLLASDEISGIIDASDRRLAFRLRMTVAEVEDALRPLIQSGFFEVVDSDAPAIQASASALREKNGFGSRHISDDTKRAVWDRDGGACTACGAAENIEYDHIIPISKGGTSTPENVQLLCRPCNRSKRTKPMEQFATQAQPNRSPEKKEERREQGEEQGREIARSAVADEPSLAVEAFNVVAQEVGWPKAEHLTDARKAKLKNRMAECGGLAGWLAAMARARASPFLRGESGRDKAHEKWVPNLDFFLQQSSFTKLREGQYDDRNSNQDPRGLDAIVAAARAVAAQ